MGDPAQHQLAAFLVDSVKRAPVTLPDPSLAPTEGLGERVVTQRVGGERLQFGIKRLGVPLRQPPQATDGLAGEEQPHRRIFALSEASSTDQSPPEPDAGAAAGQFGSLEAKRRRTPNPRP